MDYVLPIEMLSTFSGEHFYRKRTRRVLLHDAVNLRFVGAQGGARIGQRAGIIPVVGVHQFDGRPGCTRIIQQRESALHRIRREVELFFPPNPNNAALGVLPTL